MEEKKKYSPQKKWDAENIKRLTFCMMKNTESDIIEHLEKQPNKAGYIKKLIRADIAKNDN